MIQHRKNLNLIPGRVPERIKVNQFDHDENALIFTLYNGANTFSSPSGATCTIEGQKPDKTGFQYSASISGSTVTADLEEQMTVIAGDVVVELRISDTAGNDIGTANFILEVEPAALGENTPISETDLPLIQEAARNVDLINQKAAQVSQDAAQVASDKTAAQTARTGAETACTGAESARTAAETARAGAEAAQRKAETAQTAADTAKRASETAKSAAETAQTGAEAAQVAAESAQEGAEAAQTGAETAKASAETAQRKAETAQAAAEAADMRAESARTAAENAQTASETAQSGAEEAQEAAEAAQARAETAQAGAETAETAAENASSRAETAQDGAETAQAAAQDYAAQSRSWAEGEGYPSRTDQDTNNAKAWSERARVYAQRLSGGTTYIGSLAFAELPTSGMQAGDQYNITDSFVTDARFVEGAGIECDAGTDVTYGNDRKWNLGTPPGVTSFNGRKGNVQPQAGDYTKDMVGLSNVPNVSTNNQTPTFTQAADRANIVSREKLSVLFGKVMKWFADMKAVCFSGSYSDLSDTPVIPTKTSQLTNDSGFKTTDTNNAVTQTNTDSANAAYRVLFSATADDTTRTEGARKDKDLNYNPSTGTLSVTKIAGNSADSTVTFTSSDVADGSAVAWTSVAKLVSNEKHSSLMAKISQMFKNMRYLYKLLGTTDISAIGDGTVTGGISALNSNLDAKTFGYVSVKTNAADYYEYLESRYGDTINRLQLEKNGLLRLFKSIDAGTTWTSGELKPLIIRTQNLMFNSNGLASITTVSGYKCISALSPDYNWHVELLTDGTQAMARRSVDPSLVITDSNLVTNLIYVKE